MVHTETWIWTQGGGQLVYTCTHTPPKHKLSGSRFPFLPLPSFVTLSDVWQSVLLFLRLLYLRGYMVFLFFSMPGHKSGTFQAKDRCLHFLHKYFISSKNIIPDLNFTSFEVRPLNPFATACLAYLGEVRNRAWTKRIPLTAQKNTQKSHSLWNYKL